jgi:hypothetical protein
MQKKIVEIVDRISLRFCEVQLDILLIYNSGTAQDKSVWKNWFYFLSQDMK